jgi:nucleotide-binding universal stress UspA family protein
MHAVDEPLARAPAQRPARINPGYRRILVPVADRDEAMAAVDLAAQLTAAKQSSVTVVTVIEVPLDLPLAWQLPDEERAAHALLEQARAVVDSYGLSFVGRVVRGRSAGAAIVDEATRRPVDLIVFGVLRRMHANLRARAFGPTVDFVMRQAPCRVMIAAAPAERRR